MIRKLLKSLKFQIFLFMTINVLVWFLISEAIMDFLWKQELAGKLIITNRKYTILLIIQSLLYIFINIPFIIFMIKYIDKPIQEILKGLKRVKKEDFSEKIEFKSKNEFNIIKDEFNLMSVELENSKKIRENLDKQKNILFTNMSHDLKTPITTIQSYTKALVDEIIDSPEKQKSYINTIYSKSIILNELVDRLFEYAKLNSDENVLCIEKTDVAEVLRKCVASLYSEYEDHKIKLTLEIPEEKIILDVDKLEIQRVFSNLLINVLKHNQKNIDVLIKMNKDGKTIIADSGKPIPEELESGLFHPFIKGDSSRKSGEGSGLGLALSKLVMKQHGGKLDYVKEYEGYTKAFVVSFKKN